MKEKGVIQGLCYNEMKEQQSVIKTLEDAKRTKVEVLRLFYYKSIFYHKVALDVQLMNFFI